MSKSLTLTRIKDLFLPSFLVQVLPLLDTIKSSLSHFFSAMVPAE